MKDKKVAILQSNYIPWKGYFDLINTVDEFIIYDDMQFTKRDWRNRNVIKTKDGLKWLTIPVITKGKYYQKINATETKGNRWREEHWRTLVSCYSRANYFKKYKDIFEDIYLLSNEQMLTEINVIFIKSICNILGISTKLSFSSNYELIDGKTERLVNLCKQAGAKVYVTGPSAKSYIDENLYNKADIEITYFDYSGYPEYKQLFGKFEHNVSVLDLIFNVGDDSTMYMKSFTQSPSIGVY